MLAEQRIVRGLADVERDPNQARPQDERLVLFAAALRRPNDDLETALERIRRYNSSVSAVLVAARAEAPTAEIIKYVADGVLASFAVGEAATALRCAGSITDDAPRADDEPIDSRIGLSAGLITSEQYAEGAPYDSRGKPIEVAMRLVWDVAKPRQIVLDAATRNALQADDFTRLATELPGAELHPVKGTPLVIQGVRQPIPVYELVWQGQEKRDIQNRQLLRRQLTSIQHVALQLRFEIEDLRPGFTEERLDTDIANLERLFDRLDPRRGELKRLETAWNGSDEAKKITDLGIKKQTIGEKYALLERTWRERVAEVRRGSKESTNAVKDAYDALFYVAKGLYVDVDVALEQLEDDE